jgi:hypothetical protein
LIITVREAEKIAENCDMTELELAHEEIKKAYSAVVDLDWQVTKSKHIISKYKDLVVKM